MASIEEANALKQKGNKAFANHDWLEAVEFYTQAIEKNDQDPSFFCNRAQVREYDQHTLKLYLTLPQANIRLESYGYAIADATKAIQLDPGYVKVCITAKHCFQYSHHV